MATRRSDVRNRLVFSPVYVVPKFAGSDYSAKNIALSGWEISGILTLRKGFPYDISYAGGHLSFAVVRGRRQLLCLPGRAGADRQAGLRQSEKPAALWSQPGGFQHLHDERPGSIRVIPAQQSFSAEPLGTFGNVHRDPYHGPGINNTNMILAKNFIISSERGISLQLRMESDNVFNHTQFSNPTSTYGSSALGVVSGAAAGRQSQLAAKIYF